MKPIDIRNHNWEQMRDKLFVSELRSRVYHWLLAHPAQTTRQMAAGLGLDLLSVRPRCTELEQSGFIHLVERQGHEGIYAARTAEQFATWRAAQLPAEPSHQAQLL